MLIPFNLLLSKVDFKRVTIISLAVGASLLYAYVHEQNVELEQTRLVYQNPKTVTKYVTRIERGPVRIITRIVERPTGERETIIDEERGPVTATKNAQTETAPVPLSVAMTPIRTDRYLLTLGVNRLTPDFDGKALFVGYGWHNRFDLQVGGIKHENFSPWVLATFRF